jgi:hypothetical protein
MANTYIQIGSTITVGAGGASSVEFTSIPSGYTDLVVIHSLQTNAGAEGIYLTLNSNTTTFGGIYGYSDGTNFLSGQIARYLGSIMSDTSIFTTGTIYLQSYATSRDKPFSTDESFTRNTSPSFMNITGGVWANSAVVTSFKIGDASTLQQYSTVSLYGIKSS